MAPIFGLNAAQLNSKNRKNTGCHFYKTFALIPARARVE
jgi:hypothetical protein